MMRTHHNADSGEYYCNGMIQLLKTNSLESGHFLCTNDVRYIEIPSSTFIVGVV